MDIERAQWAAFNRTVIGTMVALFLAAGAVSIAFDPFGVFFPSRESHRAGIWWHPRIALPIIATLRRPDIVVLGSSRVRDGFDPASFGPDASAMNYGVSGLLIDEMTVYARQIARLKPKLVLLGFDFYMFNPHRDHQPGFSASYTEPLAPYRNAGYMTISTTAFDMIWTGLSDKELVLPSGFHRRQRSSDLPAAIEASVDGFHSTEWLYGDIAGFEAKLGGAREIFRAFRQNNVNAVAFLSPEHVAVQRRFAERGIGDLPKRWRSEMARIAAEEGVPLWDFYDENRITQSTSADFYFDGSHYTPQVGCMMVETMIDARCATEPPVAFVSETS
ncbi:hypothetical protein [Afifella pfennigii]|uniref:hypothetical protein n=1 Tax=Afifella pfennigii TaxID=209897 RepID=UPI00047B1264|nr:hypothetical protein [Afifella pfennigii]